METVLVRTTCVTCGAQKIHEVSKEGYDAYMSGARVSEAFPDLSLEDKERFISGICPVCWDQMFKGMGGDF